MELTGLQSAVFTFPAVVGWCRDRVFSEQIGQRLALLTLAQNRQDFFFGMSFFQGLCSGYTRQGLSINAGQFQGIRSAELDRSFPRWREFPGKEKWGRRFFWERGKIEVYLKRVAGVVPLP